MTTAELPKVTPVRRRRRQAAPSAPERRPAPRRRVRGPSLLGPTTIEGPRVRLGILWFLVAVAAATAGRWATALLWAGTAAVAASDLVRVWRTWGGADVRPGPQRLLAGTLAAGATALAAIGSGAAGAAIVAASLAAVVASVSLGRGGRPSPELMLGTVLPLVACIPVVLTVVVGPWAGLFLICAVSLYDAGNFLVGAQSKRPWEGPVCGVIGVLAVTFTMAAFQPPPFDGVGTWVVGGLVALACPLGQMVMTAFLPDRTSVAVRARRVDTYLVAAPLFLAGAWLVG